MEDRTSYDISVKGQVMAIRFQDDIAALLGTPEQCTRVDNFVWISLCQAGVNPQLWQTTHFPQQQCCEILRKDPTLLESLKFAVYSTWIPDRDLSWLTDSERQVSWVERYIKSAMQPAQTNFPSGPAAWVLFDDRIPHHLTGSSRAIALVDYWSYCSVADMSQRRNAVKSMEIAWCHQQKLDRSFDWLDGEGGDHRRIWFWEKLLHHFTIVPRDNPPPNSHGSLLSIIDQLGIYPAELTLFNQKARGQFQQQQRRASSKGKRQCNFVLQERTISKLDSLARKFGITRTDVIELLIQQEALNPVHTTERLRRLSALTTHDS